MLRTLRELPAAAAAVSPDGIDGILRAVARRCAVGLEEIRSNSHRPPAVQARALVSYIAITRHGL